MKKQKAILKEVVHKIGSLKNELKTDNQGLKSEIKFVYWVIGIAMAIIALMNALKK